MKRILLFLAALLPATALAGAPKASSELKDSDGVRHTIDKAFDGLLQTGWAEAKAGPGDGEWFELKLDRATEISSISIWPGNLSQGARSLREYGRPKTIVVTLNTAEGPVVREERLLDPAKEGPARVDIAVAGKATSVRIDMKETYEGGVFNDTFIAEVAINFTGGERPDAIEKALKYQGTSAAEAAAKKNEEQIIAWFDTISSAEFGDTDTLQKIMNQAADGAPFMRDRTKNVPYGWRVLALPPDDVAITALLKLKDANGIPALEMASLRVDGKTARALEDKAQMLEAYAELASGGDRNVPNWGQTGWELGALRSFGEPLPIQVDRFGDLYVGDVGNHRVQRFGPDGKALKVWGGAADITNRWFDRGRSYYVSGAAPGDKPGQFQNPVDVAIVPAKEADGLAVLDASGRVQLFDSEGRQVIGWKVRTDLGIQAGVGGEGYIEHLKGGKIAVIWGDECFVYTLDAEEIGRFEVKDGTPNGSVALKNGKLGMIFGRELVMYSLDGYRHGNLIGEGAELGEGFEDWDVTLDEKGRLWAVTDRGRVVKYKKPGKIEFSVQVSDYELQSPRLAVFDDIVYITERDTILKRDALELKAKAELAAEAGEQ